jgi:hypothetical protein
MALTNAEYQAKHRAKIATELAELRRCVAEQEAELEALREENSAPVVPLRKEPAVFPRNPRSEAKRAKKFDIAFASIVATCSVAENLEVPQLSLERAKACLEELKLSVSHLQLLMKGIEG